MPEQVRDGLDVSARLKPAHRRRVPQRVTPTASTPAAGVSDDNADGVITEDESGWSCGDNGNRICGPGNPQGVPAGRYVESGVTSIRGQ